jgi:hypothetical protein
LLRTKNLLEENSTHKNNQFGVLFIPWKLNIYYYFFLLGEFGYLAGLMVFAVVLRMFCQVGS